MVPQPGVSGPARPDDGIDISVVIPTRNRADFLPDCLDSLATQTTSASFEVVVVDNASEDSTPSVLRERSERDPRFRWVLEETLGRAAALNAGMAIARGQVFVFTDDDVYVKPGFVETYRRFFAEHPERPIFAGGTIHSVPLHQAWPAWFSPRAARSLILVDWGPERALAAGETVWGGNTAAPRDVFDALGGWDENMGVRGSYRPPMDQPHLNEDLDFEIRVRSAGGQVWFVPGAAVDHRTEVPGPRTCLRSGFGAGRNDFNRPFRPGTPQERMRGRRNPASFATWLTAQARYLIWTLAFRMRSDARLFDRAWQAAWSSGWRMEDLLAGGPHDTFDRRVRRITRILTRRAARMAPEHLDGRGSPDHG
jgi:glycosyltransferase involved in cell wall biosynthesis